MINCPKCGTQNQGNSTYCQGCGAQLINNQQNMNQPNNMNYNNLSRRLYGLGITKEEINHRAYSQNNKKKKAVIQYDLFGNYIQTFNSIADAAREIGSNTTNISAVCKGRRNSCKNFIFRYKGD